MKRHHGAERSLLDWLIMQERVLGQWIDDALSMTSDNIEFVAALESHRAWLANQIVILETRMAA